MEVKPGNKVAPPSSLRHLIEGHQDLESRGPGSDGQEEGKDGLDEYLDGSLSSDYDSEDDSDSIDNAIKLPGKDSSRDGNNSDDSIDVRKTNYR